MPQSFPYYPIILDRGSTKSIFKTKEFFKSFTLSPSHICTANAGEFLHCDGYGDVEIPLPTQPYTIKILNAKYSPNVATHLLSDNNLETAGYHLVHMSGLPAKLYQT
ncbi:hypothetical protein HDU78_011022, partial [Chytriomyces hyalinus]